MTAGDPTIASRALDLYRSRHAAVCDVVEPWEHGSVVRATSYPDYWDFNLIRVEDDPGMSVEELIRFADGPLGGLRHRRFDFEGIEVAAPLRPAFEAAGWVTLRLLWMRYEGGSPSDGDVAVREVYYDDVIDLRVAWHREDFPDQDPLDYQENARTVALQLGARVFAVHKDGRPVAFAQLDGDGTAAEITQVYVHPDERGNGLGTSLTVAALAAAGEIGDLWICADDEDRPKELYARLGFRPQLTTMEFTLMP
jgi:GNAT superfamily N-acetyltransferase